MSIDIVSKPYPIDYKPTLSYRFIGNGLAALFGNVFNVKSFKGLVFDTAPNIEPASTNWSIFVLNLIAAFLWRCNIIFFIKKLQTILESKEKCTMNSIRLFRIISFLEGLSYILLLFVAVPMKYMAGEAGLVKSLGMPHGILFVLYVFLALFIRSKMKWKFVTTVLVLVASLLPFGTFYIDRKYFSSK